MIRIGAGQHLLLGMDVGTTRVKAVVHRVDPALAPARPSTLGAPVAQAETATPWTHDARGTQTTAEALAAAALAVVARAATDALAAVPNGRIAGIGVAGMGEAGVLTGRDGAPLAPVRAWHDQRGDVGQIRSRIGERAFWRATGMPLTALPSLPKILALRAELPQALGAQRFWSVPEWVVRCLGGRPGSELSLASRTGLLDVLAAQPWAPASELVGAALLGPLTAAGAPAGRAGDGGAAVPDAVRGAVLTVAGHDHQAAAFGAGAVADGVLFDSLGTAEALLRFTAAPPDADAVERLAASEITVGLTVVPGHYCVLLGLIVGLGLERIATMLGAHDRDSRAALAHAAVAEAALTDPAAAQVRVSMVGDSVQLRLDGAPCAGHVFACAVRDLVGQSDAPLARIRAEVGPERAVVATGGWLANPAMRAAKQSQLPSLQVHPLQEVGAAGAAALAGVAAGLLPSPS